MLVISYTLFTLLLAASAAPSTGTGALQHREDSMTPLSQHGGASRDHAASTPNGVSQGLRRDDHDHSWNQLIRRGPYDNDQGGTPPNPTGLQPHQQPHSSIPPSVMGQGQPSQTHLGGNTFGMQGPPNPASYHPPPGSYPLPPGSYHPPPPGSYPPPPPPLPFGHAAPVNPTGHMQGGIQGYSQPPDQDPWPDVPFGPPTDWLPHFERARRRRTSQAIPVNLAAPYQRDPNEPLPENLQHPPQIRVRPATPQPPLPGPPSTSQSNQGRRESYHYDENRPRRDRVD